MSKFKVGDRVAVYELDKNLNPIRVVTTITDCFSEEVFYTDQATSYKPGPDGYDLTMVHSKQCRLLKSKPRQRVWISRNAIYQCLEYAASSTILYKQKQASDDVELVVVRRRG